MKTAPFLVVLTFAVWLSTAYLHSADGAPSDAPRIPPERVDLKVLKVFSAQDGPHVFRSYLVEWKGQEVIVDDRLVKTSYRVDDTITVLVMKLPHPDKNETSGLLHFSVFPSRAR